MGLCAGILTRHFYFILLRFFFWLALFKSYVVLQWKIHLLLHLLSFSFLFCFLLLCLFCYSLHPLGEGLSSPVTSVSPLRLWTLVPVDIKRKRVQHRDSDRQLLLQTCGPRWKSTPLARWSHVSFHRKLRDADRFVSVSSRTDGAWVLVAEIVPASPPVAVPASFSKLFGNLQTSSVGCVTSYSSQTLSWRNRKSVSEIRLLMSN